MSRSDNNYTVDNHNKKPKDKNRASSLLYIVVAFICALSLWFFVADYDTDITKTFSHIPVSLHLPENTTLTVEAGEGSFVTVSIKGKKSILHNIEEDDIYAYADVTHARVEGTYDTEVEFTLPEHLSVAGDNPTIAVKFVQQKRQSFEIEVEEIGSWNEEYTLVSECSPSSITVDGSLGAIEKISKVLVRPDVGALERPKDVKAKIILLDENGEEISIKQNHLKLSDEYVHVFVMVNMEKELALKVEFTGDVLDVNTDATFNCVPNSVKVYGSVTALKNMEYIPIKIDERYIEDEYTATVQLPDLSYDQIYYDFGDSPEDNSNKVDVEIKLRDILTHTVEISVDDIKIVGLDNGLTANMSFAKDVAGNTPERITITFRGYSESIINLRKDMANNLNLVADFSGAEVNEQFIGLGISIEAIPGVWTLDTIAVDAVIVEEDHTTVDDPSYNPIGDSSMAN